MTIRTRPVEAEDYEPWRVLYEAYAAFYREPQTDEQLQRVWNWLMDPDHELKAAVAVGADERLVGLAHYRPFARPLGASVGCFLDDLFVSPDARGSGAADALLEHMGSLAREHGWSVVRWITADDNDRARAKYDQHATRTTWITYDMPPPPL
jgi:GNAT superfamily N-acetyltransferase